MVAYPTYLITKDLVETLRNKYGIRLPPTAETPIAALSDEFVKAFRRQSQIDAGFDLQVRQAGVLSRSLTVGIEGPYVSMDKVYVPNAPAYLEVTRLTNPDTGEITISQRPGKNSIPEQIEAIQKGGCNTITLIDAGAFGGDTLIEVVSMLREGGISTESVRLAVSSYEIDQKVNGGIKLSVTEKFNLGEWIELRDFFGIDGRNVGVDANGNRLYIPYWENLTDWASIPKQAEKAIADLCKAYNIALMKILRDAGAAMQAIGLQVNYRKNKVARSEFDLIIFDMDGTLYNFVDSNDGTILGSKFYKEVEENGIKFIEQKLSVSQEEAAVIRQRIFGEYGGDISIGLEKEYRISKSEYFQNVWDIDASKYLDRDQKLIDILSDIKSKKAILTSAPSVWAENALRQLGIYGLFDSISFGDGNIRKPDAEAYAQVINYFGTDPKRTLVVDDEQKCLEEAKRLGLRTMLKSQSNMGSQGTDYSIREIYEIAKYLS